ncbi:MAG: peptide-methionine (S)-S-oxide reductase MsrA [Sumerlaeia bacterium]
MTEKAMFGAGCFWGVEVAFRAIPGVLDATVGYSGGHTEKPTYREVCAGRSGHAEVVRVEFDPERVSYETLVEKFFACHDPTQKNRQGPDVGSQYRSAIFTYSDEQKAAAEAVRDRVQASPKFNGRTIVTEIEPAKPFHAAEEYHQQYLARRGLGSCHM